MESYIIRKDKWIRQSVLECLHPDVHKIWFTGALSVHGVFPAVDLNLHIYFKNGDRKDFTNGAEDELLAQAEEYLHLLNKNK